MRDDGDLANRLYDMALAAHAPDDERWQAYIRTYARREVFVAVFPRVMELTGTPEGRRQARRYLFDCHEDGLAPILTLTAALWRARPDLAEAERRRADALCDLLAWFEGGAVAQTRAALKRLH